MVGTFTTTITDRIYAGSETIVIGTFTAAGGSTGGDIVTGLKCIKFMKLQPTGAAATTNASAINESFATPLLATDPTVVLDANTAGIWIAIGY
jgi:7-keto-8-aminopelargonate synthetase-like enzyme